LNRRIADGSSNQKKLHSGEQQHKKDNRVFGDAEKGSIGFVVFVVIHGRVALRSIDTHVAVLPSNIEADLECW
jgi:hypothetical protein